MRPLLARKPLPDGTPHLGISDGMEDDGAPSPMLKPEQVRFLKLAVIGMGVVFIIGLAALIGGIIIKAGSLGKAQEVRAPVVAGAGGAPQAWTMVLAGRAVVSAATNDGTLTVHLAPSATQPGEIRVFELATGRLIATITLTP